MALLILSEPFNLLNPPVYDVIKHERKGDIEVYLVNKTTGYAFYYPDDQRVTEILLAGYLDPLLRLTGASFKAPRQILDDAADGKLLRWIPAGLTGSDVITGSDGNDGLGGYSGHDVMDGGSGHDTLDGGGGRDTLIGGTGKDWLRGDDNDDWLDGGNGLDRIDGGDGSDTIEAKGDGDRIDGGSGIDSLQITPHFRGVELSLDRAGTQMLGGGDTMRVINVENLRGTWGDDRLYGSPEANQIFGDEGDDRILGQAGNDDLQGWHGRDTLIGGSGNDTLAGHRHSDQLQGGSGADVFAFSWDGSSDVILDFEDGRDRIRIEYTNEAFRDLKIIDKGDDVRIEYDGGAITLRDLEPRQLSAADFTFV